jgi:Zn-finger nucleic acid-binding protein
VQGSAEPNECIETSDATVPGLAAPINTMICPRCQASELAELDRDGITLDRCPSCRGIWLDRGELEKLLTRGRTEHDDDVGYERELRKSGRPYHSDDSSDRHRIPRRRSWWEIFD